MRGEVLSVGTELLLGQLVDTNAPWLAQSLSALGIDVYWISQVGDNQERVVQALRRGWERSDLIVISGGLGPTGDDVTRESVAELLGEEMVVQPDLEAELRAHFARRGRPMPEHNIKQATLIPSAEALRNPIGSAPGWWVARDGRVIAAMPGVPVEMKRMWEQDVAPRLMRLAGQGIILSRTLKVLGMGESQVEAALLPLTCSTNPTVATYAKRDGVHVRITAKAADAAMAEGAIAAVEAEVRRILGDHVYGVGEQSVPDAVLGLLRQSGLTLATMEFSTAGQLVAALGSSAAAPESFLGGMVANEPGQLGHLGVDRALVATHDAVSDSVARSMASAARRAFGASVGLAAVCGRETNPSSEGPPLGIVHAAIDRDGEIHAATSRYATTDQEVRRRAVLDAMDLARRSLLAETRE